jgi:hypothetical protein
MVTVGWYGTCVVRKDTFEVLVGNHRARVWGDLGNLTVPCHIVDVNDRTATIIGLADNRTQDLSSYDWAELGWLIELDGGVLADQLNINADTSWMSEINTEMGKTGVIKKPGRMNIGNLVGFNVVDSPGLEAWVASLGDTKEARIKETVVRLGFREVITK